MKTIEIFDGNYSKDKEYKYTRYAARAVIFDGKNLLIENADTPMMVMLPGGGIENSESVSECVVRECKEECGLVVLPVKELFAIKEYYHDMIFYSTYVLCKVVGECEKSFTDSEKSLNLICGWQTLENTANQIQALMRKYKDKDEELFCCHYREYLALKELADCTDIV